MTHHSRILPWLVVGVLAVGSSGAARCRGPGPRENAMTVVPVEGLRGAVTLTVSADSRFVLGVLPGGRFEVVDRTSGTRVLGGTGIPIGRPGLTGEVLWVSRRGTTWVVHSPGQPGGVELDTPGWTRSDHVGPAFAGLVEAPPVVVLGFNTLAHGEAERRSWVAGLDPNTGRRLWQDERAGADAWLLGQAAWSAREPLAVVSVEVPRVNGPSARMVTGLELDTGRVRWSVPTGWTQSLRFSHSGRAALASDLYGWKLLDPDDGRVLRRTSWITPGRVLDAVPLDDASGAILLLDSGSRGWPSTPRSDWSIALYRFEDPKGLEPEIAVRPCGGDRPKPLAIAILDGRPTVAFAAP